MCGIHAVRSVLTLVFVSAYVSHAPGVEVKALQPPPIPSDGNVLKRQQPAGEGPRDHRLEPHIEPDRSHPRALQKVPKLAVEEDRKSLEAHHRALAQWREHRLQVTKQRREHLERKSSGQSEAVVFLASLAQEHQAELDGVQAAQQRLELAKAYVKRLEALEQNLKSRSAPLADILACRAQRAAAVIARLQEDRPATPVQALVVLARLVDLEAATHIRVHNLYQEGREGGELDQLALTGVALAEARVAYCRATGDLRGEWLQTQTAVAWGWEEVQSVENAYDAGLATLDLLFSARRRLTERSLSLLRLAARVDGLDNLPRLPAEQDRKLIQRILRGAKDHSKE